MSIEDDLVEASKLIAASTSPPVEAWIHPEDYLQLKREMAPSWIDRLRARVCLLLWRLGLRDLALYLDGVEE